MIFITGAAGKTGRAIIHALAHGNNQITALVRTSAQAQTLSGYGNLKILIGDLNNLQIIASEIPQNATLYHICPNVSPFELEIGRQLIRIAQNKKFDRFIYHSVLHPQVEEMPHHWQKMRVEEELFKSGLDFTILQPCAYMQNILGSWKEIKTGRYSTPYKVSAKMSLVDLNDVAEAAARVILDPGYANAIFELAGPDQLDQNQIARYCSSALETPVAAVELSREDWLNNSLSRGMALDQALVLIKMFEYYDQYGFVGNPAVLSMLLTHPPTHFQQFLERTLSTGEIA